ncbi:hypothetical protein BDV12DRAFT_181676 [Aspergillus spectabilis]
MPSFVLLISMTCTWSCSASSHRPSNEHACANIAVLSRASSAWAPSNFSLCLYDFDAMSLASAILPLFDAYQAPR